MARGFPGPADAALFLRNLAGGGIERMRLHLAASFAARSGSAKRGGGARLLVAAGCASAALGRSASDVPNARTMARVIIGGIG